LLGAAVVIVPQAIVPQDPLWRGRLEGGALTGAVVGILFLMRGAGEWDFTPAGTGVTSIGLARAWLGGGGALGMFGLKAAPTLSALLFWESLNRKVIPWESLVTYAFIFLGMIVLSKEVLRRRSSLLLGIGWVHGPIYLLIRYLFGVAIGWVLLAVVAVSIVIAMFVAGGAEEGRGSERRALGRGIRLPFLPRAFVPWDLVLLGLSSIFVSVLLYGRP